MDQVKTIFHKFYLSILEYLDPYGNFAGNLDQGFISWVSHFITATQDTDPLW